MVSAWLAPIKPEYTENIQIRARMKEWINLIQYMYVYREIILLLGTVSRSRYFRTKRPTIRFTSNQLFVGVKFSDRKAGIWIYSGLNFSTRVAENVQAAAAWNQNRTGMSLHSMKVYAFSWLLVTFIFCPFGVEISRHHILWFIFFFFVILYFLLCTTLYLAE